MPDLSPRQRQMLDYILSTLEQTGVPPTYRDIGKALGIKSTNGVSDHLKALERKGYIERVGGRGSPRAIRPTGHIQAVSDEGVAVVPVVGRVAAGMPALAAENYDESFRIDRDLLPSGGRVFGLVVQGESMIEDGIHDGDIVFVREQPTARNGEIAVVRVEDEATVKRLYRDNGKIRLEPANSSMSSIIVDPSLEDVAVLGIVVGMYRRF